ncbi:Polyprenol-phosphate-mannose-dependent alpha-(1-2)-phosphatidylinositol mannoside mannosyltransferase [Gimesia chilikensis]|uniref:Polyprenol-phosphate-mannose-dependent alpha-(1-2)-phosphatidylinositol mannoside mannosyltransferase n=1 Tax=Gimesia chilikensis TaxID=2605989 RepID=A0A517W882_9PLAN|nr:Polyprenol-phosphate-mannose-dependent alpha-(1-2)-phosphatidylinositol mannoside mannosyltransferase [Gimesia chilikensis]
MSLFVESLVSEAIVAQQNHWPAARKILWVILFLCALVVFAPGSIAALRPADGQVFDFFKEWASVQNRLSGQPVYLDQELALEKHLNLKLSTPGAFFDHYNTHPPSANLIAVPFAWLSYQEAQLAWNLTALGLLALSLYWIVEGLKIQMTFWTTLALLTLLLATDPLQQTLIQGQPNLLLGLLIVGAWKTGRSGKSLLAGSCLGLATAVKIYPAYLFLYFLVRRDFRALLGGALSLGLVTLLTVALFGIDAYRDYLSVVLPSLSDVTNNWGNASLLAFWERLFEQSSDSVLPVVDSPALLKFAVWSSWIAVTSIAGLAAWRTRNTNFDDQAFGITIVAMLLMTPTTWHHYFIILLLPIGLLLTMYTPYSGKRWLVNLLIIALAISPRLTWALLISQQQTAPGSGATPWEQGGMVAQPWQSLTALSYQCYALLLSIVMLWPLPELEEEQASLAG